jgi:uncharacterized membrane protein
MHISEQPDLEELTPQEIGILNIIVDKFEDISSAEISAMSQKEDAWKHRIMKALNMETLNHQTIKPSNH